MNVADISARKSEMTQAKCARQCSSYYFQYSVLRTRARTKGGIDANLSFRSLKSIYLKLFVHPKWVKQQ